LSPSVSPRRCLRAWTVRPLASEAAERGTAALDTAAAPAAACTTFDGTWQTDASAFAAAIAPAAQVDFSFRGDRVTHVTEGAAVPRDEYLSCCGILLDFFGGSARGGRIIWSGNTSTGFAVTAVCATSFDCGHPAGIRMTFVPAVTAAGIDHPGSVTATMFDEQNMQISTQNPDGSGLHNFLGYKSAVPIDHAEFKTSIGADANKLIYHRCL
jgi:hypothetical protein